MKRKYKIISEELMKNLVSFLDEIQFDAVTNHDKDSIHKVNFCNWAISELINSYDARIKKNNNKKSRNEYIEETFFDWNLPDMSDDEFEKLVDTFDNFLRAWEKEYYKDNFKKKPRKRKSKPKSPNIKDVAEYMSLNEIKEYLLYDEDLTDEERFELYYEEHLREKEQKKYKGSKSLDKLLKELGIAPASKNNPKK
tara:strand:- start:237 stop:824 length:588 start_codon:yes stop_codon:yes gene_type:complete